MDDSSKPAEDGFEYQGRFYPWHVSDLGKDLMLIDRFSGLPLAEFYALIEDDFDRTRVPILLTMVATSLRAGNPDWSVERITRTVMNLGLSELVFVDADAEEDDRPPSDAAQAATDSTGEGSSSRSNGSLSSSTPPASSTFETLSGGPA